jgi:hypothetical protein
MIDFYKLGGQALIAIAVIGTAVAGYFAWRSSVYDEGYAAANEYWKGVEARISKEADGKYKEKLEAALADAALLREQAAGREKERLKKEKDHEKALAAAESRVAAGAERLRIATLDRARPLPGSAQEGTAEVAFPAGPEEGADIVPAVAAAFVRIAAATARDVRDYNALLDEHHALESACSK